MFLGQQPVPPSADVGVAGSSRQRAGKTPLQKEVLEASFQLNAFPSEDYRRALGERIELSEQQVQAWFVNRRRKDKKQEPSSPGSAPGVTHQQAPAAVQQQQPHGGMTGVAAYGGGLQYQGAGAAAMRQPHIAAAAAQQRPIGTPINPLAAATAAAMGRPPMHPGSGGMLLSSMGSMMLDRADSGAAAGGSYAGGGGGQAPRGLFLTDPPREDYRELIQAAKATIPGYREDGPPLGYLFDPPPVQLGAPASYGAGGLDALRKRTASYPGEGGYVEGDEDGFGPSAAKKSRMYDGDLFQNRLDVRVERERYKEDERRRREEVKLRAAQDKAQEKELRKVEALREKERKAEEKRRASEDKRREKEMVKAMVHGQDKQLGRLKAGGPGVGFGRGGPVEDLDLEWSGLLAAAGLSERDGVTEAPSGGAGASGSMQQLGDALAPRVLARPEFPPATLGLQPAFPPELGDEMGGQVLMVWNFLFSFSDVLGLLPPQLDDVVQAVVQGRSSRLLESIHVTLIRLLQADMEEAHAAGAALPSGPGNFLDRALAFYAHMLEEALGWGFDIDTWRAHLSSETWPEVLRQVAIMAGAGPKRAKPQRGGKPKMGVEGEDVIPGDGGQLTLRLPSRFGGGTVKAAAWLVLSEAGPAGLLVAEIARRMQKLGLRDLKSTRTPEASLAGAMARDVVFVRVAPSTFALQSCVTHHKALQGGHAAAGHPPHHGHHQGGKGAATPPPQPTGGCEPAAAAAAGNGPAVEATGNGPASMEVDGAKPGDAGAAAGPGPASAAAAAAGFASSTSGEAGAAGAGGEEGEYSDSDDNDEDGEGAGREEDHREPWLQALMDHDYEALSLPDRLAALTFLVDLVVNGPSVRARLDVRAEDIQRLKKQLLEEVKNERKRKPAPRPAEFGAQGAGWQGAPGGGQSFWSDPGAADNGWRPGGDDDERDDQRRLQERLDDALRKVDEDNPLRMEPLGMDRRYNRYWRFTVPTGEQQQQQQQRPPHPSVGRIFVESAADGSWRLLTFPLQLDALASALDPRGVREAALLSELERLSGTLRRCMPAPALAMPAPVAGGTERRVRMQADRFLPPGWVAEREEAALACPSGAVAPGEERQLQALKGRMQRLEVALPDQAIMAEMFDRDAWLERLRSASNALQLRSCLSELEAALMPAFLAREFLRCPPPIRGVYVTEQPPASSHAHAHAATGTGSTPGPEATDGGATAGCSPAHGGNPDEQPSSSNHLNHHPYLSWLPPTYSAISLRLSALDASLLYRPSGGTGREQSAGYKYTLRPLVFVTDGPGTGQASTSSQKPPGGAILVAPVLPLGKIRALQLLPLLPGEFMCLPPRDFQPPLEQLRTALQAESLGQGPVMGSMATGHYHPYQRQPAQGQAWLMRGGTGVKVAGAGGNRGAKGSAAGGKQAAGARGRNSHGRKGAGGKRKGKKGASREDADSDRDYGEGYDDGLDELLDDPVKLAYNPRVPGQPPRGRSGGRHLQAAGDDD